MANTLKFGNGQWATKEGSTLAYNDENGNFKPLPFTFDRASSATRVNKQGLIETVGADQPRIDYSNDSNGALLLEPSRTNLIPNSENMTAWNTTSLLSVTGGNVGVYGSTNAYNIIPDTTATSHRIWLSSLGLSSNTHTFTIYAKANGCSDLYIYCNSSGVDYARWFNLETGSLGGSTGTQTSSITPIGNDWYKLEITGTSDLTSVELYLSNGTESISWSPNGIQGMLMQFGQLEVGSYPTSYIPTQGSAVTRVKDTCSQTVPDGVIGQTEGTLFLEVAALTNTPSNDYITISDGTNNNFVGISFYTGTNRIIIDYIGGGVPVYSAQTLSDITLFNKIAINYNGTSLKVFINGNNVFSSSVNSFNASLNTLLFSYPTTYNNFIGKTNQIQVFTEALSDEELQKLTTI